ncbi:MAG: hypothetical protein NUW24_02080 [Anaerolineae bacterium]|nr:hypothetical protein [Anaerolineae bacterium]MDH7472652.1 hypothetical protein [Anaerolineae bacterium]
MNELPGQVQKVEEEPTPQEAMPESESGEEQKKRKMPSPLEMLFREAEVIAQNLKESGTRR